MTAICIVSVPGQYAQRRCDYSTKYLSESEML